MLKKVAGIAIAAFLAYVAFIMLTSGALSGDPKGARDAGIDAGKKGAEAIKDNAPNVDPATNVDKGLSWWDQMMALSPHMGQYIAAGILAAAAIGFWRWLPGKGRGLLLVLAGVVLASSVLK